MNRVKSKIEAMHTDSKGFKDKEQLKVIFSPEKRIVVEAPAGYGKTRTMISKIAYLIATNQVPHPKKALALTFSVNAAYKIKRDIAEKLPQIFEDSYHSPLDLKRKIFASNYHGFCRKVLKLYGYLISDLLVNIDNLKCIDDSKNQLNKLNIKLMPNVISELSRFGEKVNDVDKNYIKDNYVSYLNHIVDFLLPNGYITFNGILLFVFSLFEKYDAIVSFYNHYFSIIIIDEYQDTNVLSNMILEKLIGDNTQLLIMGDPLQRIYGFIGAIPEIMSIAEKKYNMQKINLETNHRFSDNPQMVLLDENIRKNAENIQKPNIQKPADIVLFESINQFQESKTILNETENILKTHPNDKVVILVRGWRYNSNTNEILKTFNNSSINYFNALFNDDDEDYIDFHQNALNELNIILKNNKRSDVVSKKLFMNMQTLYSSDRRTIFKSLLKLLNSFLRALSTEYKFLNSNEKIEFIKDTLENRSLKQYLEYVNSRVILTTIHGAKGLEWEHVIMADMEKNSFPSQKGLCGICKFKKNCQIDWNLTDVKFIKLFYEELSVFYVGTTRAKKQTKFTCSKIGTKTRRSIISCFLKMEGINHPLLK